MEKSSNDRQDRTWQMSDLKMVDGGLILFLFFSPIIWFFLLFYFYFLLFFLVLNLVKRNDVTSHMTVTVTVTTSCDP